MRDTAETYAIELWQFFDDCDDCDAPAGQPCRDLRYAANRDRTSHVIPNKHAHHNRQVKAPATTSTTDPREA